MPRDYIDWLANADTVAMALLAIRLTFTGLFRAYPALYAHAILETLLATYTLAIPLDPHSYGVVYMATTPARWVLWTLIGTGLYRLTLELHSGLLTAGRWIAWVAAAVSLFLIALTLRVELAQWGKPGWLLAAVLLGDRTVTAVFAVLILTLCGFLAWFVVPMRRNCAYLCMGFGVIFVTRSVLHLIRNARGDGATGITNSLELAVSATIFLAFAILLNREGETHVAFVARNPSEGQVEDAVRRLRKINKDLREGDDDESKQ